MAQAADDPILALQPQAEAHWDRTDPAMAALSRANPLAPTRFRNEDPFQALVEAIAFQQVSLAAGAAIHGRVQAAAGGVVAPAAVVAAGEEALRTAGLSRSKVGFVLDLAERFLTGRLGPHIWRDADDAQVLAALCHVKGIGAWTAKMFLMFHLQRPDVCAPEDLGLRQAFAGAFGGSEKEAWTAMAARAAAWSPYNTVAARVLWKARRGED